MTPADKQKLWNALYKCTRNGYPGATYEAYDKPTDPRVRGGKWNWKQRDLRALFDQLVVYADNNEPTAAWRELEKYKTKISPACLRSIYQSITFFTPPSLLGLELTFDNIANADLILNLYNPAIGDSSNVADWNIFFDLPTLGSPFTSVVVSGNVVTLFGGSNIIARDSLFDINSGFPLNRALLSVVDNSGCIVGAKYSAFGNDAYSGSIYLTNIVLPELLYCESYCFSGRQSFFTSATIYIPKCSDLGGSVLDDQVFANLGDDLILTVPISLQTCNAGNPDGDLDYVMTTRPASIINYV